MVDSGKEIEVDTLACTTGFERAYVLQFNITGDGGVEWSEESNIYLSGAALVISPSIN